MYSQVLSQLMPATAAVYIKSDQVVVRLNIIIDGKVGLSCLPLFPSKIGDLYRYAAFGDRQLGKRSMNTHNDGVIDIDWCLRSILYGPDKES